MDSEHLNLLCDVDELTALMAESPDVPSFLHRVVTTVGGRLETNVCSIYLFDEKTEDLVLRATIGLKPSAVNNVRMEEGEGLVGTAMKELRPILDNHASRNPRFRSVSDIGEEEYDCFLAIPIRRGIEKIGVLTAQRAEHKPFEENDIVALTAVASQLAGTFENAQFLLALHAGGDSVFDRAAEQMELISGTPASPGMAIGPAWCFGKERAQLSASAELLSAELGLDDFRRAVESTATQIQEIQARIAVALPEAASMIFDAHLMMLRDESFSGTMSKMIEEGLAVGDVVVSVAETHIARLSESSHAYMRDKAADVEDLATRLIENLQLRAGAPVDSVTGSIMVVAHLLPSDIAVLAAEGISGMVLVGGGIASHVAILARALGIPVVIVDRTELLKLTGHVTLLVDGDTGNLYIDPTPQVIDEYHATNHETTVEVPEDDMPAEPARTREGAEVHLLANINLLREVPFARKLGAEGVGLYRTEFPFLVRSSFPSEAEQCIVYSKALEQMNGRDVTFRTLDVGGEKGLAYYDYGKQPNPVLGLMSIRFCLKHPDILTDQVRAILRAGADAERLRIMFPMISSLDEFRKARGIVEACLENLAEQSIPHKADPELGMMIETPSALLLLDVYAQHVDFFSIGTNDFTQYMLAVDRSNSDVAEYYCPHHPAVLRGVAQIASTAREHGRDLAICGEMAHHREYLPFLLGIGIRSLSVDPHYIPDLRTWIAEISVSEAEKHAARLLEQPSVAEVESVLF
ncbi:MAG: phosphoenolpyruvate--protein phosphotransferase [Kiritimatiellia bacterium]|jgi:phosphotransferase system enzyme I (PtsP)|nr:phosphoenolpyruvate--protein phosphotransferase [Kiritimatiellia bacterium]